MDILIAIVGLTGLTVVILGTIGSTLKVYDQVKQELGL